MDRHRLTTTRELFSRLLTTERQPEPLRSQPAITCAEKTCVRCGVTYAPRNNRQRYCGPVCQAETQRARQREEHRC